MESLRSTAQARVRTRVSSVVDQPRDPGVTRRGGGQPVRLAAQSECSLSRQAQDAGTEAVGPSPEAVGRRPCPRIAPVATDKIVWIDCEMTGLKVGTDELVEIACIVTDFDLNPVDEGIDIVIRPSDAARAQMGEFVTNMHTASGLIDELDAGTDVASAEQQVIDYIRQHVPASVRAPLGGNSVGTDKQFLQAQMPHLVEVLHYRIIDVSSIKELAKRWYPRAYYCAPAKTGGHRALGDIQDSIRELQYYRTLLFRAEEPTGDEATAAAQAVSGA
ncbi:oligoribonuclease [Brevibacterium luteolum]|uniref:Oligoribonuclease n=2 Tax=Brevibacterium luteolum TaxID=199591 RepID=A0A2N6PJG3_9MICO|nr:oligoribonuclease [Brevibacterium luteolum]